LSDFGSCFKVDFQQVAGELTDYFLRKIDQGYLCGMMLVDLREDFDLVNHDLNLLNLDLYGSLIQVLS